MMEKIETKNFEREFKELFERHNVRAVCVFITHHDPISGESILSAMGDSGLDRLISAAMAHYHQLKTMH